MSNEKDELVREWQTLKADNAKLREALAKIYALRFVDDANEPFDEALDIADEALGVGR